MLTEERLSGKPLEVISDESKRKQDDDDPKEGGHLILLFYLMDWSFDLNPTYPPLYQLPI